MKKTLTILAIAAFLTASFSSFAVENNSPVRHVISDKIIISYLDIVTVDNMDTHEYIFAADFEYFNTANGGRCYKKQYVDFLKAQQGVKHDCQTSYEILDQGGRICMAKATMKFKTFTRVDYITLTNDTAGWKVSKVVTTYP